MRQSLLVARKDVLVMFRSPLAYIMLACFLFLAGYFFTSAVKYYELLSIQVMQSPEVTDFTPMQVLIAPYMQNAGVILLFFLPLMTMRGFSEEKRTGAFELLMSYPVSEVQLMLGKLAAMAVFLAAALALGAVAPVLVFAFSEPDFAPMIAGYLGLFLMGMGFASLGLFISSLTENQIVSAVLTFCALLVLWLLSWLEGILPQSVAQVTAAISLMSHFEPFTRGVIELADVVYYLTFTAAFCWLAVLSLENQRWRG